MAIEGAPATTSTLRMVGLGKTAASSTDGPAEGVRAIHPQMLRNLFTNLDTAHSAAYAVRSALASTMRA
jgi:hypothetical protein